MARMVLLACIVGGAIGTFAQEERPQIMPGERKPKSKKDTGPRALGVLQMGSNGKASLVPVAILINGKFWDAGAYKADPVPMALDYGTIYEAERTGNSLGLFTVAGALRRNNSASGTLAPWIGTGTWRPNGSEPDKKPAKADAVPVGIDTSEGPPRLTRDNASKDKPPDSATKPSTSSTAGSGTPSSSGSGGSSGSSDGPPRLTKPASSPDTTTSSAPGGSAPSADGKTDNKKASESKAESKATIPASDSGASEGNRPKLRRGKPAESFADEDVPGYSKVDATSSTSDSNKAAAAAQGDVQLVPAISDAGGPEIRSFVFQWLNGEEDDRRKQMTDLAKDQLRAYIAARAKATITPAPARSTAARSAAKPKDPVLENVHMVAYDVWLSNQPVLILSAEGHRAPPAPGTAHSGIEAETQYSVLIVAYPDIYNNLHKLYVGITDKFHLDITPRLELVDAVDADGDGRGELLFRQTSDQGTGWVVYRPTADKLWKIYDSLRPE